MTTNLKLIAATAWIGLISAPALSVQAQTLEANWSSDVGPSLFQSLDITPSLKRDVGSTSGVASARSHILPAVQTNLVIIDQPAAHSSSKAFLSPEVSTIRSVAPQPSKVATGKRDTHPASPFTVAAPPPSRPVNREADQIPLRSDNPVQAGPVQVSEPVQTAQLEQAQMNDQMKPGDPADMLKGELANDPWGAVLQTYTKMREDGLVTFDYAALVASEKDMKALSDYLEDMASKKPSTFTREQAMVYWANLYNAITVKVVAENYPVKSIRKIKSGLLPGPWKRDLITVEGEELSLDNIEHDIMRPTFKTPLVHYMVNCASIGCPNLKQTPWQVATLDEDLDAAARAFINSSRGVSSSKGRLKVSSIYKWFSKDFGGGQEGVLQHLSEYADDDVSPKLIGRKKIDKYGYDWGINAP